jgi:hypothetical protein
MKEGISEVVRHAIHWQKHVGARVGRSQWPVEAGHVLECCERGLDVLFTVNRRHVWASQDTWNRDS